MRPYLAATAEFASGRRTPRQFLEDSLALARAMGAADRRLRLHQSAGGARGGGSIDRTLARRQAGLADRRHAGRHQGHHRDGRHADRDGLAAVCRLALGEGRRLRARAARRRRRHHRQDGHHRVRRVRAARHAQSVEPAHTPGGSSSGSAASVAAGIASAALGTQVISSTVRPASYCGCVGFKPSVNALNREGSHDYPEPELHRHPRRVARRRLAGRLRDRRARRRRCRHARPARAGSNCRRRKSRKTLAVLETAGWDVAAAGCQGAVRRLRRAAEIRRHRRSARATTTKPSRRWRKNCSTRTELSHRCNGFEGQWFFRIMRDRDASKLGRITLERTDKYDDLTLAEYRADLKERARIRAALCRARRELRRLHHARRARRRAGGTGLDRQSGIRRAVLAAWRAGSVAAAVRGRRHAARPAGDRLFRPRRRRVRDRHG